jgi:PncC family amidohydrolase
MAGDAPGDRLGELAQVLQAHCLDVGATVGLAETCTGGMVAAALTDVAGSSGYLLGGVVAYSDAAKRDLLGVDPAALEAHGAVSAQVARAMAFAARERFAATIGASVTGIAGPAGASAGKPIGLTYVGVADGEGADVRRIVWTGDRAANRRDSAVLVLEMLLERLGARTPPPASDPIRA